MSVASRPAALRWSPREAPSATRPCPAEHSSSAWPSKARSQFARDRMPQPQIRRRHALPAIAQSATLPIERHGSMLLAGGGFNAGGTAKASTVRQCVAGRGRRPSRRSASRSIGEFVGQFLAAFAGRQRRHDRQPKPGLYDQCDLGLSSVTGLRATPPRSKVRSRPPFSFSKAPSPTRSRSTSRSATAKDQQAGADLVRRPCRKRAATPSRNGLRTTITSALSAGAISADQIAAAASLPAGNPTNGGSFEIARAEAKALGAALRRNDSNSSGHRWLAVEAEQRGSVHL